MSFWGGGGGGVRRRFSRVETMGDLRLGWVGLVGWLVSEEGGLI
jgi:hypothetical protein